MARILIIDDEEALLEEIQDVLTFEGYEAIIASDGETGIELALKHKPDLVICDVMMPGMDGYHVLLEFRTHEQTALLPFLFLTALADRHNMRHAMELGADDYLTKPFSREELLRAVQTRLGKYTYAKQQADSNVNELRQMMLTTLPHELRTPLVSILGYAEILAMDAEFYNTERIAEIGNSLVKSGKRLYRLIENYLFYTQLEMVKNDPNRAWVWRQGQVDNTRDTIELVCRQLALDYERDDDLILKLSHQSLALSEEHLKKVVYEVVDNAFKFSKPDTPVTVQTVISAEKFEIMVIDQGRGMQEEDVYNIAPYRQFERQKYEQQGMGLGLAIAKSLIEFHKGEFDIHSIPQLGTTVTIALKC